MQTNFLARRELGFKAKELHGHGTRRMFAEPQKISVLTPENTAAKLGRLLEERNLTAGIVTAKTPGGRLGDARCPHECHGDPRR
jgi:hypothetical protein